MRSDDDRRPTCETCPFWDMLQPNDPHSEGECRRHPPTIPHTESQVREGDSLKAEAGGSGLFTGWWPTTGVFDWCGEHPRFEAWAAERDFTNTAR